MEEGKDTKKTRESDQVAGGKRRETKCQLSMDTATEDPTEVSGRDSDGQDLDRNRSQERQEQERRQLGCQVQGRCLEKLRCPREKLEWKAGRRGLRRAVGIRLQEERK